MFPWWPRLQAYWFLWLNELLQLICITSLQCFPEWNWQFIWFGLHSLDHCCTHFISNARKKLILCWLHEAGSVYSPGPGTGSTEGVGEWVSISLAIILCFLQVRDLWIKRFPSCVSLPHFTKYFWQLAFHPVQQKLTMKQNGWKLLLDLSSSHGQTLISEKPWLKYNLLL